MKRVGLDGRPLDDDQDPFEWYDQSSSSGVICRVCGALVARMTDYAIRHREWHVELSM
jgi:hypothetical protein